MNLSTIKPTGFSLLQVQGPEAIKFLQGQVTCDLNDLDSSRLLHGAHCTAKGRMIANFDAIKRDEQTVWLRLPSDNLAPLQTSLGKYIVFSKAKLTDLSATHQAVGVFGNNLKGWLQDQNIHLDGQRAVALGDHLTIQLDEHRVEIWSDNSASQLEGLQTLPELSEQQPWQLKDIELGRGWITAATGDAFLPQDLNLQTEAINGINFKKGCYTGQEIVARMHYKGKLKRHLYRFSVDTTQDIPVGADLVLGDKPQSTGTVINSAKSKQGYNILAVTTETAADSADLHIAGTTSSTLTLAELPYAITNESLS